MIKQILKFHFWINAVYVLCINMHVLSPYFDGAISMKWHIKGYPTRKKRQCTFYVNKAVTEQKIQKNKDNHECICPALYTIMYTVWSASNQSNEQFNKYQKLCTIKCYFFKRESKSNRNNFCSLFQVMKFVRVKLMNCLTRWIWISSVDSVLHT